MRWKTKKEDTYAVVDYHQHDDVVVMASSGPRGPVFEACAIFFQGQLTFKLKFKDRFTMQELEMLGIDMDWS